MEVLCHGLPAKLRNDTRYWAAPLQSRCKVQRTGKLMETSMEPKLLKHTAALKGRIVVTFWIRRNSLYANETRQASQEALESVKRSKKKQHKKQRKFIRGLNLQRTCELKFGAKLGGIKVCQLEKQAETQKWHLLTEAQAKQACQLTDSLKISLGLDSTKGWKALPPDTRAQRLKNKNDLPRWNVPGSVLEDKWKRFI